MSPLCLMKASASATCAMHNEALVNVARIYKPHLNNLEYYGAAIIASPLHATLMHNHNTATTQHSAMVADILTSALLH